VHISQVRQPGGAPVECVADPAQHAQPGVRPSRQGRGPTGGVWSTHQLEGMTNIDSGLNSFFSYVLLV